MNSEKIVMCFCGLLTVLTFGFTDASSEIRAQEIKLTLSSEVGETREKLIFIMPAEIGFHRLPADHTGRCGDLLIQKKSRF